MSEERLESRLFRPPAGRDCGRNDFGDGFGCDCCFWVVDLKFEALARDFGVLDDDGHVATVWRHEPAVLFISEDDGARFLAGKCQTLPNGFGMCGRA